MKPLGEILARYRKDHRYTQTDVAKLLKEKYGMEVSIHAISHWEKDTNTPSARQFFALCELYEIVDINDVFNVCSDKNPVSQLNEEGKAKVYEYASLLVKSGAYEKPKAEVITFRRKLKKYHLKASAGTGQYLDSDAYDVIEVGDEVSSQADFGITITGNSMEPLFINGQTVWVHSQEQLGMGEIGIFYYDGNAYCKKYTEKDGQVQLISLNPSYDPILVDEDKGFRIFGKVVG